MLDLNIPYVRKAKKLLHGPRCALQLRLAIATAFKDQAVSQQTERTREFWETEIKQALLLASDRLLLRKRRDKLSTETVAAFFSWLSTTRTQYAEQQETWLAHQLDTLTQRIFEIAEGKEIELYFAEKHVINGCDRNITAIVKNFREFLCTRDKAEEVRLSFSEIITEFATFAKQDMAAPDVEITFGDMLKLVDCISGNRERFCVPEFLIVFDSILNYTHRLYSQNCEPLKCSCPLVTLELERTDRIDGMFDSTALGTKHKALAGHAHRSIVTLAIRDKAFDWNSATQLPYVLVHEIFCRAFQDLLHVGPRNAAADACAWSDGWMDALAVKVTEMWLAELNDGWVPAWVKDESMKLNAAANHLHGRRTKPPIAPLESGALERRRDLAAAPEQLRKGFQNRSENPARSWQSLYKFSLLLNVLPVPHEQRNDIAETISMLLKNSVLMRKDLVINVCEAFIAKPDWEVLSCKLSKLLQPEIDISEILSPQ